MLNTEILLLRHGESFGNTDKTLTGHTDVSLTEKGLTQAEAAADFLLRENIDVIYSSDLSRAYNTAEAFSRKSGIPICALYEELREVSVGEFEGVEFSYIVENLDKHFKDYFTFAFGSYSFPGGETTEEAGKRLYSCLENIALENPGKKILVATHAAVIRSFWGLVIGIPRNGSWEGLPFPSNASVSRVSFDGVKFSAISYSENEHLKSVGFIDYNKSRI